VWPRPIGVGLSSDPGPLAWPAVVASVPTRYLNVTIGDRSRANHAHSYPNNPDDNVIVTAERALNVRYWHLADIQLSSGMSASGGKADMA
jgi:hypothetical protein